jgi:hypothetical protein
VLPGLSDPIRSGVARPAAAPAPLPPQPAAPASWGAPASQPANAPAWSQPALAPAPPVWSQPAASPAPAPYQAPAPHYAQPSSYGAPAPPYGGQYAAPHTNNGMTQAPPGFSQPGGYSQSQAPFQHAPSQQPGYSQAPNWGGNPQQQPWTPQRNPVGAGEDTTTLDAPRAGAAPVPAQPQVGGPTMHQPSPYQPQAQAPAARAVSSAASLVGRVKLVVEQGKILGEQFLLTERELIIGRYDAGSGRCPDIDLTAQDPAFVHRQHVRLVFAPQGSEITVYDMGGRNGSYVNNQLIARNGVATLHLGDKLRIGRVVLRLQAAPEIDKDSGKIG